MTFSRIGLIFCTGLVLSITTRGQAGSPAQDEPAGLKARVLRPGGAGASLQTINDEYARQLLQLEQQRLDRLGELAARQQPVEAAETYEQLFRLAIGNNLFREAEPAAHQVLKSARGFPPIVQFLAQTIDVIASADRGAHDESLTELRGLLDAVAKQSRAGGQGAAGSLDTSSLLALCEAYYQRLLQGSHFDAARKAFQMLQNDSEDPAIKGFCASRLNQLDMIGKPAPAIQGTDLDGKPVRLADLKGNVVLVVFWATWCVPCSAELATLEQVYSIYQNQGFRIVGINVDVVQHDGAKLEDASTKVRRFLIDNNVRWPNLINGAGTNNYAKAYGVSAIPSNVLVGRDGNVIHLDLSPRKNLATVIAKSVAP